MLRETMVPPKILRGHEPKRFEDRSGVYVNIRNGFRVTTDQPDTYIGTIYIFGSEGVYGLGSRDEDTIASHLQRLLFPLPFRVVNCSNFFWMEHGQQFALMETIPFQKNDMIISAITYMYDRPYKYPLFSKANEAFPTVDAVPTFEKHDMGDTFILRNSYNSTGNKRIAELLLEKIKPFCDCERAY